MRWRPGGCTWTCGPPSSSTARAAASSVRRRLSALSSFYRYCAAHDLTGRVPTQGVVRPVVDPDYTATVGLDRDQARALVAAADADTGMTTFLHEVKARPVVLEFRRGAG